MLTTVVHLDKKDIETYIYVDVEAQRKENPGYDLMPRAVFYCGRMLSAQYGKEFDYRNYDGLKKVYSIWICINCSKEDMNSISRYRLQKEDIYGTCGEHRYDYIEIIMVRLPEKYEDLDGGNSLIEMAKTLLTDEIEPQQKKDILESKFEIPMTEDVERRLLSMCNLSEGIYQNGVRQGKTQGIEQGRIQGIAECVLSRMKSRNISVWDAMDDIDVLDSDKNLCAAAVGSMLNARKAG